MEAQRNLEAKIIKPKLGLLELSHQLGRVTQACKVFGYSRDSFYRFKSFMRMEANLHFAISSTQKRKQNRLKRMESARDFIKQFSRNSIKLLFGKRSTNLLRCCRTIWMNGCGNTMNHVRTAGNIAMGKRRCRHSWIPYHLQKRKCCSIVTTFQTKKKYDGSSDDVIPSTTKEMGSCPELPLLRICIILKR